MRIKQLSGAVTSWLVVAQTFTAGVAFLVNLLSSSSLVPADRGYLALLLQLGYLSSTLAALGVERPFISQVKTSLGSATGRLHRLMLPGLAAVSVVILASGLLLLTFNTMLGVLFIIGSVFITTDLSLKVLRASTIVSHAGKPYVLSVTLSQAGLLAMAVVLALMDEGRLWVWSVAYVVAGCIPLIVAIWVTAGHTPTGYPRTREFAAVRSAGLRLLPGTLGNMTMQRCDRLLLPILASPADLGIYVMASTAVLIATWPAQQWSDSMLHRWATNRPRGWQRVLRPVIFAAGSTLVIALAMSVVVWVSVDLLLNEAYQPAKQLLMPLALAAVIYSVSRVQLGMLIAAGRSGRVTLVESAGMVASIVACIVLIPPMGAQGAAWATLLGYSVCVVFAAFAARHGNARQDGESELSQQAP